MGHQVMVPIHVNAKASYNAYLLVSRFCYNASFQIKKYVNPIQSNPKIQSEFNDYECD
ncbi:uncharacterized protein DS421_18g605410 [Arachis hypogaea]|nr:uncharacterized protein DS421_18g605410 [Arachis hypogaea]